MPARMLPAGIASTRLTPAIAGITAQDIVIGMLAHGPSDAGIPIGDLSHFRPLRGFDFTEALIPPLVEYTLTFPTRAKNPMKIVSFRCSALSMPWRSQNYKRDNSCYNRPHRKGYLWKRIG